ncbi:MAG TPA: CheR family methyltransferase [Acidobacteriaceae bacterium]|jgi:chemotaxis methyl-accepting protein methylase
MRRISYLYLSLAGSIWKRLPQSARNGSSGRAWGRHLDRLVRRTADRKQYFATFFLRNRAEMEMLRRLADQKPAGGSLNITVLACSKGAEVYSMLWAIRSARPDLQLNVHAIDISQEIVDFAAKGVYSLSGSDAMASANEDAARKKGDVSWNTSRDQNASMFERVSPEEADAIFEIEGNQATVRPWLRQGITWMCGDAGDPGLQTTLGPQDIVVANRFLCHMEPPDAASCLRNIGKLVKPGGYLFVTGIDLDVRANVARQERWSPIGDLSREIHEGDTSILSGWPLNYWGLEPFDHRRPDAQIRYASVFRLGEPVAQHRELASSERSGR